jgi:hypothetical protein
LPSSILARVEGRYLAAGLAQGRIAIGGVSLLAPGWTARTMTTRGDSSLFLRMVGARDIGLGLGTLIALGRGTPARGWLEVSALVDGLDVAACVLARDNIRTSVFPGAVGLATAGALLSAWLARAVDSAESAHPEP